MSDTSEDHFEIHASLAEELRHSDNMVWQFGLAIVALEEGSIVLTGQSTFQNLLGKSTLVAGFLLSVCLSFVLVRQAYDRRDFVIRIKALEDELRQTHPKFFPQTVRTRQWAASMFLAWVLLIESSAGFIFFACRMFA